MIAVLFLIIKLLAAVYLTGLGIGLCSFLIDSVRNQWSPLEKLVALLVSTIGWPIIAYLWVSDQWAVWRRGRPPPMRDSWRI